MGPLNDEIKLQVDETTKQNMKSLKKKLEMYIINFKTIRYKLRASGNIIHSTFNYKPMRPVSNLRLPKEQEKTGKNSKFKKKINEKSVEDFKK